MQKKWIATGLLATTAMGLWCHRKRKKEGPLSFQAVREKMERKGYSVFRTPDKGVFLLVKNHTRSLFIYDNQSFTNRSLFNLLHDHEHGYDHELFLLSETTNTLFAKTKTLFYRWHHTQEHPKKPFAVHFSTLSSFLEDEEPTWETNVL